MSASIDDVKSCPAFSSGGCPFATLAPTTNKSSDAHPASIAAALSAEPAKWNALVSKCPAFKDGCPFANKTQSQVSELMSSIPWDHQQCPVPHGQIMDAVKCSNGVSLFDSFLKLRLDMFADATQEILLASQLKEGTKDQHRAAQRLPFIKRLISAKVQKDEYIVFLVSLYHLYDAMETALEENKDNKYLKLTWFPKELSRRDALIADLTYLCAPANWRDVVANSITDATRDYVKYVKNLAKHEPQLLLAHAYTRYLGDLAGGQILKKKIKKALSLDDGEKGIEFYEFPEIKDIKEFKELYRAQLNKADLSQEQADGFVAEANNAYNYNLNLFRAIEKVVLEMDGDRSIGKKKSGRRANGRSSSGKSKSFLASIGIGDNASAVQRTVVSIGIISAVFALVAYSIQQQNSLA
jgi:heme oxygenase